MREGVLEITGVDSSMHSLSTLGENFFGFAFRKQKQKEINGILKAMEHYGSRIMLEVDGRKDKTSRQWSNSASISSTFLITASSNFRL